MKRSAFTRASICLLLGLALGACEGPPLAPDPELRASVIEPRVLRVPRDYASIQAAVDAAGDGTIIQVRAGTYSENVVITTAGIRLHASRGVVLDGTGRGGIGIHVLGSPAQRLPDVEISGFEVQNYAQGITLEWAEAARVHLNEVHQIRTPATGAGAFDGRGILVINTRASNVTRNTVMHAGQAGMFVAFASEYNVVRGNRANENGDQAPNLGGVGISVTGAGAHHNQILENETLRNFGRGIWVTRPSGTAPLTGNIVAQNRSHYNQRSGIATGPATFGNLFSQNDARWNNLSGLPPCYQCNLMEMSNAGGNTWERNLGTLNLTDACLF
jgi:parallel beta-helix repeat protein